MSYVKRKEARLIKSEHSGLWFDFKTSEYIAVSSGDESYFRLQGYEIYDEIPTGKPKVEIETPLEVEEISYEEPVEEEKPKKKHKKKK